MLALFGGTFNPVHNGHIALAREVAREFTFDSVQLIPSYLSVHRDQPTVSPEQRLHMLKLAIQPYAELAVNDCEIARKGPSYTVDTLLSSHARHPGSTLCLLLGADAFNSFLSWKQPERILELAHLIVCARPQHAIDRSIFPSRQVTDAQVLPELPKGSILFYQMQPNSCSSTRLRHILRNRQKDSELLGECLPAPVLEYIRQQHLYE
jgi:nicotinate-nucleotide adenylyltransferase